MGTRKLERPEKLAEKLLHIRLALGMSQTQIWKALELEETSSYHVVSKYETGLRAPSIPVLLRYARLAGVSMEVLADDELTLPAKFLKRISRR